MQQSRHQEEQERQQQQLASLWGEVKSTREQKRKAVTAISC